MYGCPAELNDAGERLGALLPAGAADRDRQSDRLLAVLDQRPDLHLHGHGILPAIPHQQRRSHSRALCRSRAWYEQCGRRLSQLVRKKVAVALSEVGQGRFQRAPHTNYAGKSPHHPCSVTRMGLPDREGRRPGRGALEAVVEEVPPQD